MIDTATLLSKLSSVTKTALEKSANLCISLQNYEIEIEHFFLEILSHQDENDFKVILNKWSVSQDILHNDLKISIHSLLKGNFRTPVFSAPLIKLLEHGWAIASAEHSQVIRSGHLIIALLNAPELQQHALRASALFEKISVQTLKHTFTALCRNSSEAIQIDSPSASNAGLFKTPVSDIHNTPALDLYTVNLTLKALNGEIDPVTGRETEIRQMLDILTRRRQNNPILTGEPGVGKTAVVEGLAIKIAQNEVPPALQNIQLHVLDMGLLQAGASVKGEFENRLKQIIKEVQSSLHPVILFIDEAHTLIGAGGSAGQNDAANLLKPALARGELRTIAATTWSEYKQFFEKDAALSRRFQLIEINEPSEETAIDMLRAIAPVMSAHFQLEIEDEAIIAAVQASHRYISGRQLPDKAISVLDTAAARVALTQNAPPVQLNVLNAQLHNLQLEEKLLENEQKFNPVHDSRLKSLQQNIQQAELHITALHQQWQKELTLIHQLKQLTTSPMSNEERSHALIPQLRSELSQIQGNNPLVAERVNSQIIHEIISDWTGIPAGKMASDEIRQIFELESRLNTRVKGQQYAIQQLVQGVKTSKAQLEDPCKPHGVFLLAGPSGVGKTETALALADELYGGESHLITINMSEYQEAHTVSALKGSPPGYVGYGQGGILTEAVRRNPYSVILLDEIEKAHGDVQELFYQVFDKGCMEDSEGRQIDFKNTIILLTSNTGSAAVMQHCLNMTESERPSAEQLIDIIKPALYKEFRPAFIGRMRIVPYFPLHDELLLEIIHQKLTKISKRIHRQYGIQLKYSEALTELLLSRCTEVDSGARNIDHILSASVLPLLATEILVALSHRSLSEQLCLDVMNNDIVILNEISMNTKKKRSRKTSKAA